MGVVNFLANIVPRVDVPGLDPIIGNILQWLNTSIGNICITMIVFAVLLKVILLPLDFISKRTAKKNQLIQERIKPQLDKIDKQCGDDKRVAQQRKSALMKKSGHKTLGACLPMLITMGLTIYVFFGVNSFVAHTNANNYNDLAKQYEECINDIDYYDGEKLTTAGEAAMLEKFEELTPSFLWIKNPMRPDAWQNATFSYEEFKTGSIGVSGIKIKDEFAEDHYNQIIKSIANNPDYQGWNGLMIIPILAFVVSVLSQIIMSKTQPQPQASAGGQTQTMTKMMKFIGPAMTLYFTFMYTAVFSIYMFISSLFTLGSTFLLNKIVNKVSYQKEAEIKGGNQSYRRK